jgi:hypothetical protein
MDIVIVYCGGGRGLVMLGRVIVYCIERNLFKHKLL